MPKAVFSSKFDYTKLVLSISDLLETYFFGIPLRDQDGRSIDQNSIKFYIESAQTSVEDHLGIKLFPQIIEESKDFIYADWKNWSYVKTTYPVTKPLKLNGFIQSTKQIEYPPEWLSSRTTSDGKNYNRAIFLVPGVGTPTSNSVVYSGITPHLGFFGNSRIPNYWQVTYKTGFEKIPSDIIAVIGKLAAISIFHIMGDLILGTAGIASQSVGIDGLSQSISTTSSATNAGYGARILGYVNDLKEEMPRLRMYYKGISFQTC